jgi:outer membrane protein assembly factor BamB
MTEERKILPVIDPNIRMWSIYKDEERILAGSYRGHLAEIVDGELKTLTSLGGSRAAIWTIEKFGGQYLIGTANGEIFGLDAGLHLVDRIFGCDTGITYMTMINDSQMAFGNVHGDIHILNPDNSTIRYVHNLDEKVSNTIWSIVHDASRNMMRVGYSNGQLRTFALR